MPRDARRAVVPPRERIVDDSRQRRERRVVAQVVGRVVFAEGEAEERFVPAQRPADDAGVGIEHQLVGIEAMTGVRREGTVDAVAIELARLNVRQIAVPDHVGLFGERDGQRLDFRFG